MMVDVFMDEEDIVIYPICLADGCEREVRSITYATDDDVDTSRLDIEGTTRFVIIGRPCGHVQPSSLVWVTRDGEPECGV